MGEDRAMNLSRGSVGALCLLSLVAALSLPAAGQKAPAGANWPSFRGPNASGVADGRPLPAEWDVPASRNVRWKTPIPGLGHSSPVIWGDRLFVSTAISGIENPEMKVGLYGDVTSVKDDTSHRWIVYCLDTRSGKIVWEKTVVSGVPKVKRHPKSTHASSTLATDGRHVVAFFGSEGLYCFDMNGTLLWKRDFGVLDASWYVAPAAQWEFGSSPVIYEDMVLIQVDVQKDSFLAALSVKDGRDIWRTPRADVPTWGTPTVLGGGPQPEVVVNGYKHAGGYDLKTGKEVWRLTGGGDIPVPTPVVSGGFIFLTNAHGPLSPVYAIKATATGDISLKPDETSNAYVAWSVPREGAYMATPIVYGDLLYNIRWQGVLMCYEAASGKRLYQERLASTAFTSSPVAGDGKIYFPSEDGDVYVVKAGPTFSLIAKNPMGEVCMASPAIADGTLYFRTKSHVLAIK
jgi:outer membrane protein assembly factor BamB